MIYGLYFNPCGFFTAVNMSKVYFLPKILNNIKKQYDYNFTY